MNDLMPKAASPQMLFLATTKPTSYNQAVPTNKTRSALIEWLRQYRDDNRGDEIAMAQFRRVDLERIAGRATAEEALLTCEASQASGQSMIASLKAKILPDGLPPEDVRSLHLAIQTAILSYEHQARGLERHHAVLSELLPYGGQVENIPAAEFVAVSGRVFDHLQVMQRFQNLANDAIVQSGGFFGAVVGRWGLWDIVQGFG